MNELVALLNGTGGRHTYNAEKAKHQGIVGREAIEQGFQPVGGCWGYLMVERDRRRDPSNIMAGAIKIIEDGLQEVSLLAGDGWEDVRAITPVFAIDSHEPGVLIANDVEMIQTYTLLKTWNSERRGEIE